MTQNQRVPRRAITVTNVLAIVAVIAVSLCLVVPTLAKIKEPSRRAMCADNLRRMAQGMFAYGNDHQGKGPILGWFNYDVAESSREAYGWGSSNTKVLIGMGLLHKKYDGGQYDMLYCPSTYATYRDNGWKTAFDPAYAFTYGGYNYAIVFESRTYASPDFVGPDPFPPAKWSARFTSWINGTWKPRNPGATFHVPNNPALVFDFIANGGASQHAPGMNVMYMDGHVRFHDIGAASVSNQAAVDVWYKVSLKQ